MIRDLLEGSANLSAYAVAALLLFMLVFAGAVFVVARMSRRHVDAMSRLPLNDDTHAAGDTRHE